MQDKNNYEFIHKKAEGLSWEARLLYISSSIYYLLVADSQTKMETKREQYLIIEHEYNKIRSNTIFSKKYKGIPDISKYSNYNAFGSMINNKDFQKDFVLDLVGFFERLIGGGGAKHG